MSQSTYTELQLDPGSVRRKSKLGLTTILKGLLALAILWACYFVVNAVYSSVAHQRAPHKKLYQDLAVAFKPSDVVQPLIGRDQTFSIVATVWIRDDDDSNHADGVAMEGGPILHQRPIYSDVIFSGLHLTTKLKDLKSVVDLRVPLAIFHKPEIWNYDLRASFVAVPDSPSILDSAVNYSSWIPSGVNYPAVRYWPDGTVPSIQERIVDSYGTFIPLLELRPINSTCSNGTNSMDESHTTKDEKTGPTESQDDDEMDIPPVEPSINRMPSFTSVYSSTRKHSPTEAHPYVVTRTHIRMVDVAELYNRTEYEKHHAKLRAESCGAMFAPDNLDWRMCWKEFSLNANSETRVKLRKKDPKTQQTTTEWAYGPYMSASQTGWGPLDLVKVPVDRGACDAVAPSGNNNQDADFVDIKWNVAFSVRSPGQLFLADTMGMVLSGSGDNEDTEAEREKLHSKLEYANGLNGHRFNQDAHPRRHSVLYALNSLVSFVSGILTFHYWYTRSSTVGISTFGTGLLACASLANLAFRTVTENTKTKSVLGWVLVVLWQLPFSLVDVFALKAVTRVDFSCNRYWVPVLKFAPASHQERASARIEARVTWLYTILIYSLLTAVFSLTSATYFFGPAQPPSFDNLHPILVTAQVSFIFPATCLGYILQIYLNTKSRTFAGTYHLCTTLYLLQDILIAARGLPFVVGGVAAARGVPVFAAVTTGLHIFLLYQASAYPPPSGVDADEDRDFST